ncbi:type II toxin-antitoxin system RelE family toxin [Sandaracinobacteroides saxicola]|uniref:Type II toxin-antitoxin system RelE/ParE family toxin n=1 Tax=Sandaracinobacteroides saxicola TaxID=2759707 RepID=A0A7G5IEQ5_9SPHN|nr:type II toxin-antitoxin system RelE/ParE family toxin [Sandaracinobacteroides saxicola]QMW21847.1 type II toxin-antitoxin system RelE/ParE family toxin [Sandaracinobacteroides saxicola]
MQIIYLAPALKSLRRLDAQVRIRIEQKMIAYAANPDAFANSVTRLQGQGLRRLRVGDYRVIFTEDGVILTVHQVGPRGSVYRSLS